MVSVVFSTSAKANYDVDILGGSIPGIPAQRLGVPQEVVGRSHVKIKRSFNENLFIFSAPQVSSAVCFLLSSGASFIRFNNILYDVIIHLLSPLTSRLTWFDADLYTSFTHYF